MFAVGKISVNSLQSSTERNEPKKVVNADFDTKHIGAASQQTLRHARPCATSVTHNQTHLLRHLFLLIHLRYLFRRYLFRSPPSHSYKLFTRLNCSSIDLRFAAVA